MSDELTLAVLREIRDEIRLTRTDLGQRIDATNQRIDATNQRIDGTNDRLGHVESALLDLAEQQRFVVRWLTADERRSKHLEAEVDELRGRVESLERRVGSGSD